MTDIRNQEPEKKSVLHNWLQKLSEGKREKFLKIVGDEELFKFAGSEDEFRAITGREIPDRFPVYKPLSADEIATPEVTEEMLDERMAQIEKSFPGPLSVKELREKSEEEQEPEHSLDDLRKLGQPEFKISISIEQMKQTASKA